MQLQDGTKLKPCRACNSPCKIEIFENEYVEKATIWMCSNSRYFGGNCPDEHVYLTEAAWNEA